MNHRVVVCIVSREWDMWGSRAQMRSIQHPSILESRELFTYNTACAVICINLTNMLAVKYISFYIKFYIFKRLLNISILIVFFISL